MYDHAFMSSATFSLGNLFLKYPDYNSSTNMDTYFLNFYLSFIFLCSKYCSNTFSSFTCLSTSNSMNFLA